ncbi:MAG TPA: minor capsid protein [Kaistia sp.]|nr:minor capsid protein [Kaistia sp.]
MRLEGLADRLQSAGLGTLGTDLFVYIMPDTVTEGVLLRTTPADAAGAPIGATVDHELPGYRPGARMQLVVRAPTYPAGFDKARAATAALRVEKPVDICGDHFNFIRDLHEPIVHPRADGSLEFAVNFVCNYVAQSS